MATTKALPTLVLDAVERGEAATLDAVRKCVDIIEETVGVEGSDDGAVRKVTGSVFEMVEQLLTVQHEFMRDVIRLGTGEERAASPKAPRKAPAA